jgi:hypothetical protein
MLYDYKCLTCCHEEEQDFPIGKQPEDIVCESCFNRSERNIKFNGVLKGLSTPGSAVSK